ATVTEGTTTAAVPFSLGATTVKAALVLASSGAAAGIVSTQVLHLAEGVLQAMFVTKLKLTALGLLVAGSLVGAGLAGYSVLSAGPLPVQKTDDVLPKERPKANDLEERRAEIELQRKLQPLMEKRLEAVKEQIRARAEEFIAGKTAVDVLLEYSHNLMK